MTADDYERQAEAMIDVLILYPNDLLELVAYVSEQEDAVRAGLPCEARPIFKEVR